MSTDVPRLVWLGCEPPRVGWINDTTDPGEAAGRGAGFLFANVEGERSHIGLLPGQAALVVTVDSRDALALRSYILAWQGPQEGQGGR